MKELFDAIREACPPPTWSQGVKLSRADAVRAEPNERSGEAAFRIQSKERLVAPVVTLYPEDLDWECNCGGSEDPCAHVAAAVIAWKQSAREGRSLEATRAEGTVRYHFTRAGTRSGHGGALEFERFIVTEEGGVRLETTLEALASGRVEGPRVSPNQIDAAVEVALGATRRGHLPRGVLHRVLEILARGAQVELDGAPIEIEWKPLLPAVRVSDVAQGVRLELVLESRVDERFEDEIVRCGNQLRQLGKAALDGRERAALSPGRVYGHDELATLATETLPNLGRRLRLDIESEKLPSTSDRERPRIVVDVARRGDRLSLLASLVYGTPPTARVDGDRLVHLQGAVPIRDKDAERSRLRHLREELGLTPGHRVDLDPGEAIAFSSTLASWREEIRGDAHRDFHPAGALLPDLKVDGERGGFELRFAGPGTTPQEPRGGATGVLKSWRSGESWVALQGGGFAALPVDWLERFGNRVADLLAARDDSGKLATSALPDLGRLCEELDYPRPLALDRLAPLLDSAPESGKDLPSASLPDDLRGELRPYQRIGVDWLCFMRELELGALLADDMGLGKTLQALCAVEAPTLVVAPTSLLQTWKREAERFRPGLSVCVYHGTGRQLDPHADMTVTSYALLRLDIEQLVAKRWRCLVLDEAQAIKNPESQVAQAAFRLDGAFRVAMTGTPVENRLQELWSQLHFLNRGLLGGRRDFNDRYASPMAMANTEGPDSKPVSSDEARAAATHLRERLRPFVLRRRKQEVAPELPTRSEVVLLNELSQSEREVYDAVRAARVPAALERLEAGGNVMAALEALLRLRQAACHSALVPGQEAKTSSKLELLSERLDQAVSEGHKALVFSQWTSLLDKVEPMLEAQQLSYTRLDGSTRDRQTVVDEFQGAEGPPILLASLKAGGTGLTLTAADHVFLLDPWWNPAVEDQAADRAHRIGQTRPVIIHRLVSANTVEEQILSLQDAKRELSRMALEDAEATPRLSREDLRALLR